MEALFDRIWWMSAWCFHWKWQTRMWSGIVPYHVSKYIFFPWKWTPIWGYSLYTSAACTSWITVGSFQLWFNAFLTLGWKAGVNGQISHNVMLRGSDVLKDSRFVDIQVKVIWPVIQVHRKPNRVTWSEFMLIARCAYDYRSFIIWTQEYCLFSVAKPNHNLPVFL